MAGRKSKSDDTRKNLSSKGRWADLRLFLIFTSIAALFWLIRALNDDSSQSEYQVPLAITAIPDSVTLLTDPPAHIPVTVSAKASVLLRRTLTGLPPLRIPFSNYAKNNTLSIPPKALMAQLRAAFGQDAVITLPASDTIKVPFTTAPPKKVPLHIDADITTTLGKTLNGSPYSNTPSVTVYALPAQLDTITTVYTAPLRYRDLTDPITVDVPLRTIPGTRISPTHVKVTIPVEPLEQRKQLITITPADLPPGTAMALFPQKTEVTYLIPMSQPEQIDPATFQVTASYRDIAPGTSPMVRLRLSRIPPQVQGAILTADSVEYTLIRQYP